jgi:agmatine deiminase
MPAEWEPAEAVWISWPHKPDTWPGRFQAIEPLFADLVRTLAEVLPVRVLASDAIAPSAQQHLAGCPRVDLVPIPTNDCWIRDYGPSFVQVDHQLCGIDWRYNAWGGKYPPWDDDDRAAKLICRHANIRCQTSELCLEGGAIETDGRGRLLTTGCLLTKSRNPDWTKEQIAEHLYQLLGITEIAWVDGGSLQGDDTDGHIDQLARFIDPQHVVVATCEQQSDPNWSGLQTNLRQLEIWGACSEPAVEIHRLPIPPARFIDGARLPESYCNFLRLGDECTLVPTFGCKQTDDRAIGLLHDLLSTQVIGFDCRDLVWGLGALHCASLNQPISF